MSLKLFQKGRDFSMAAARSNPALDLDEGFFAAMSGSYDAMRAFRASDSEHNNRLEYVQGVLDRLYLATGEKFDNPEAIDKGEGRILQMRNEAFAKVQNRLAQLAKSRPDLGLGLLTEDEIVAGSEMIGRRAVKAEHEAEGGRVSWPSSIGAFVGSAGGTMRDPVNMAAMVMSAPLAAGRTILKAAGQEAGIAGLSETAVQALNYDYRRRVDPDYTLSVAMGEVGLATAGGAVVGGTVRGIAKGWERWGGKGAASRALKDKANIVKRAAAAATSPFRAKTAATDTVHNQAVTKSSEDLMAGKPVELPPEAFLAANARPGRVYDADGRSVGVNYEVVEASTLVSSHTDEFLPNPLFPQELQPRARERPITREQVNSIAAGLQPERLGPSPQADSGAPIIGPDNLVESGNGRVLAIRKAYRDGNVSSSNYRNFLKAQGFNVDGMTAPVLVARRNTDLPGDARVGFVTAANRATAMRLSATEQALADARLVGSKELELLAPGDIGTAANRPFVRAFLAKLPRAEQGSLVDAQGNLSMEGVRRVQAALLGRAYGEPVMLARALEDADSNIKAIAGALGDAAGAWSRLRDAVARGAVPQGMDITDDVLEAVRLIMKARDEGVTFKDLLNQAEMFEGPSEIAKAIGKFLFRDGDMTKPMGRAKIAEMLEEYATEAQKNLAGERLFGDALDEGEILRTALGKAGRSDIGAAEKTAPAVEDLFTRGDVSPEQAAAMQSRLTSEAMEKAADDPLTDEGVLMAAERMVEQERLGGLFKPKDAPQLVVAHRLADGSIRYGEPGQIHADLIRPEDNLRFPPPEDSMGFAVPNGPFLSREEALKVAARENPELTSKHRGRGGLQAELYNNALRGDASRTAPQPTMVPVKVMDAAGNETEELRPLQDVMDELDAEIAAAERIEACATGAPATAEGNGGGGSASSGELGTLLDVLNSPRGFDIDADGNITGVKGVEARQANPELDELLTALRAPKKFTLDADGNVTSVEAKE